MGWQNVFAVVFQAGNRIVINGNGFFFYNGAPAAGNLIYSISLTGGTDSFGNVYYQGANSYDNQTNPQTVTRTVGNEFAAGTAYQMAGTGGAAPGAFFADGGTPGSGGSAAIVTSGTDGSGDTAMNIELASKDSATENFDASGPLMIVFGYLWLTNQAAPLTPTFSGSQIFSNSEGTPSVETQNGFTGGIDATQSDDTSIANTNNGTVAATISWTIPENDAQVGTKYVIEAEFVGTSAPASPQTLGFKPILSTSVLTTSNGDTIGGTALPVNTGFTGKIKCTVKVLSKGTSGTCNIFMEGGYAQEANLQAGSGTNFGFISSQITGHAINTTINNTIAIATVWGASSASQTVTVLGSTFTRKGP
jgi:hypothetical protein